MKVNNMQRKHQHRDHQEIQRKATECYTEMATFAEPKSNNILLGSVGEGINTHLQVAAQNNG